MLNFNQPLLYVLTLCLKLSKILINLSVVPLAIVYWCSNILEFLKLLLILFHGSVLSLAIEPVDNLADLRKEIVFYRWINILLVGTI